MSGRRLKFYQFYTSERELAEPRLLLELDMLDLQTAHNLLMAHNQYNNVFHYYC